MFVLLSRNRSGSGALGSMLDKTRSIHYFWEVFHEGLADRPENYFSFMRHFCQKHPDAWMPSSGPARFDSYMRFLGTLSDKRDAMISIKYNTMHHFNKQWLDLGEAPTLFRILRERKIPIVHLRRKNHLRVYVSALLAGKNGVWHTRDPHAAKVQSLPIDAKECLRYLLGQVQEDGRVDQELKGYPSILELEYARMFDLRGCISVEAARALAEFCQVPANEIGEPDFVKTASRSLRTAIENIDEIETALKSTPFEWMLTDP